MVVVLPANGHSRAGLLPGNLPGCSGIVAPRFSPRRGVVPRASTARAMATKTMRDNVQEALTAMRRAIRDISSKRSGFAEIFNRLCDTTPCDSSGDIFLGVGTTFDEAMKKTNVKRNRYCNVLPYDNNIVRMRQPANAESDYVNASYVQSQAVPGLPQYIVTQGPLDNTVAHFWQMVWEHKCDTILMLTKPVEGRAIKCATYYPKDAGAREDHGRITVENVGMSEPMPGVERRQLLLSHKLSQGTWPVEHLLMTDWPDHGVPSSTTTVRGIIRHIHDKEVERREASGTSAPLVVHCSAGIGRSGALIVVDTTLRRLVEHGDVRAVDIAATIAEFRSQRAGIVQTLGQFEFCHRAVVDELESMAQAVH